MNHEGFEALIVLSEMNHESIYKKGLGNLATNHN